MRGLIGFCFVACIQTLTFATVMWATSQGLYMWLQMPKMPFSVSIIFGACITTLAWASYVWETAKSSGPKPPKDKDDTDKMTPA